MDAVVEPRRREILRLVRDAELPAGEIASRFPDVSRPTVSEHLRVLREAGLVSETKVGRQRLYQLEGAALYEVQEWLHPFERFWREKMRGLRDVLDSLDEEET